MFRVCWIFLFAVTLQGSYAIVSHAVVNMYSEPTEDADVVSQAIFGMPVQIISENGGWIHIRTPDAYAGWTERSGVVERDEPYVVRATVATLFAHVYRERSITRRRPVLTLPFESRLQIGEISEDGWIAVRLPDGRTGWIQPGDVSLDPEPISPAAMLELSRRFLGLPYTWGGTSSFGYDCSGFTQMLLRQRGILMPRDAHEQAAWAGVIRVEKENLEPGDLLFFGPDAGRITHTGMYLGSDEFIHATAHERPVVQVSRLTEAHWMELFLMARRVK